MQGLFALPAQITLQGITHVHCPEFRKIQKQLEEEITQNILEEVVLDLCPKLVARTVQHERKIVEQKKQEEGTHNASLSLLPPQEDPLISIKNSKPNKKWN